MRMSRMTALGAAVFATLVVVSPVAADQPARGCPDNAFLKLTYFEFRDYSISLGNPPSAFPPEPGPGWVRVDQNADGYLCIKDIPDNPGTLFGLAFIAVDNVSNQ
jgi:hypothetical protein